MKQGKALARSRTQVVWVGVLLLAVGVGGFFLWAATVTLAQGVVASGTVVVEGKRRSIQHLEGGIVKAIHVRDGDRVETGQLLLELEDTRARAAYRLLRMRLLHTLAEMERLEAERDDGEAPRFMLQGDFSNRERQQVMRLQQSLFEARKAQFEGQSEILQQRSKQLQRKIAGLEGQLKSLNRQQELVVDELGSSRKLFEKKLIERPQILKLEKEKSALEGESGGVEADIAATRVAIGEAELEILQLTNNRQKEIAEALLLARERMLEYVEKIAAARDVLQRTRIHAPEEGVVIDLVANTVGGVVAAGVAVLDLVPSGERLMVEARIQPAEVNYIFPGIKSRVRLLAFKQRTAPQLWGEVAFVSADALEDERGGQRYYLARIVVPQQQLERLHQGAEIVPGMPVEVLIDAGERTAMEYWLEPVRDVIRRGMREQ